MQKNGIAYDFNLSVPEKLNIEEIDICKAYVNIFDNAINAAKALEENRYIKIKASSTKTTECYILAAKTPSRPTMKRRKRSGRRPRLRIEDSRRYRRKIRRTCGGESKRRHIHLRFCSEGINNTIIIYKKQPRHENCCGCCCVILFRLPRRGCFASLEVISKSE